MTAHKDKYKATSIVSSSEAKAERLQEAISRQRSRRWSNLFSSYLSRLQDLGIEEDGSSDEYDVKEHATFGTKVQRSRKSEGKWNKFAHKLMFAQTLKIEDTIPYDICSQFIATIFPRGKRCLLLRPSHTIQEVLPRGDKVNLINVDRSLHLSLMGKPNTAPHNVVLLARKTGQPFGRFWTVLPPDCLLDCIVDLPNSVLWIIDVIQWHKQAISESAADFRFFWLASKVAELKAQPLPEHTGENEIPHRLLVASLQATVPPYSLASLKHMIEKAFELRSVQIQTIRTSTNTEQLAFEELSEIPFALDGLVFYASESYYEPEDSGEEGLSVWIPLQSDPGVMNLRTLHEKLSAGSDTMQLEDN